MNKLHLNLFKKQIPRIPHSLKQQKRNDRIGCDYSTNLRPYVTEYFRPWKLITLAAD